MCAWFATVAIVTVGYGDLAVVTAGGRCVAAIAMLAGTLVIALPVTVVGSTFHAMYTNMSAVGRSAARVQEDTELAHAAAQRPLRGRSPLAGSSADVRPCRARDRLDVTGSANHVDAPLGSDGGRAMGGQGPQGVSRRRRSSLLLHRGLARLHASSIAAPISTMLGLTGMLHDESMHQVRVR